MRTIRKTAFFLVCMICINAFYACDNHDKTEVIDNIDIEGEWVYDNPADSEWQSMKFVENGSYFCYSDNKNNWTNVLETISRGVYSVKGNTVTANNGTTYLDMTVSTINSYQFTGVLTESAPSLTFHKVLMRTHLNFGEKVTPPYADLVDAAVNSYRSHDKSVAVVDGDGTIRAVANNGRTYVDVVTIKGTAVIKVMVGNVDDGDEGEYSPIIDKSIIPESITLDISKAIIGQWVYDESYWEALNFLENGKVYYSNGDAARGIYNDNASGDYAVDEANDRLTMTVLPQGGTQMTVSLQITQINKYRFTARFYRADGSSTGTFSYSRLLSTVEMDYGESETPEYSNLLEKGAEVTGYKSHNTDIAEVDNSTGEITCKGDGRTYIDVVTTDGTAVVEVQGKPFLGYEYEKFVGVDGSTVKNTFGSKPYYEDSTIITYNISGKYKRVQFHLDQQTGLVSGIAIVLPNSNTFTNKQMIDYLTDKFTVYAKGTTDETKAFINAEDIAKATVGIVFYTATQELDFVKLGSSELFPDYGSLIGKTRSELFDIMGDNPFSDSDEYVAWSVDNSYIKFVMVSFSSYGKGVQNTAQAVVLSIRDYADKDKIYDYLNGMYAHMTDYSTSTEDWFVTSDYSLAVILDRANNMIQYMSLGSSTKALHKTIYKQVKNAKKQYR